MLDIYIYMFTYMYMFIYHSDCTGTRLALHYHCTAKVLPMLQTKQRLYYWRLKIYMCSSFCPAIQQRRLLSTP